MRFSYLFLLTIFVLFIGAIVHAQDILTPLPNQDYLDFLLKSVGGIKGLKGLALVVIISQILMNTLRVQAVVNLMGGKLKPVVQWTLVTLFNLVGAIVVLKDQGLGWAAIATHAQTLAAWQVFYHQGYKLYLERKA
jgi:formate/nitrite transporter FocA (FNT family)